MDNTQVFNQVIILFLIMFLGVVIRKKEILNNEINKGLSELLINVTLPCMIIASFNMNYNEEMMIKGSKILLYSVIIHFVLICVSYFIYLKNKKEKRNILRFITVFSNTGFMGYPILYGLLGQKGVLYASIFNIPFNILIWTVGVTFFTGQKDFKSLKKVLINPSIIAVLIGIIIFRFSINLWQPIEKTVDMIGSITTPISMIIIGSMLAERKIKEVFTDFSVYYGAVIRLVVIPLIVFGVLKAFKVEQLIIQICVILQAMPAAVVCAIIAEKYNGDAVYASQTIFITTLFSVITIPAIILLLF